MKRDNRFSDRHDLYLEISLIDDTNIIVTFASWILYYYKIKDYLRYA